MKTISGLRCFVCAAVAALSLASASAQVSVQKGADDQVSISVGGKPFSTLYLGRDYPKPFFAPLTAASGEIVTRRFPMEKVAGESHDHQHHRGLFIGYGEINGLNFWENEFKYESGEPKNFDTAKNGLIVLKKIDELKGGEKSGLIAVTLEWVGPDKKPILEEKRSIRIYDGGKDMRMMDFDFTLTAKQRTDFADTKEGFFAIRIADSMTEKHGGVMTNSEGAQTEKNVWGKPADWVDYDGEVDGKKLGIAIFDHPGNLHHPERWHSRGYGLFAVNPFGVKDFAPESTMKGGYEMKPGGKLRFRYRVIIHPGDLNKQDIDKLYAAYAK